MDFYGVHLAKDARMRSSENQPEDIKLTRRRQNMSKTLRQYLDGQEAKERIIFPLDCTVSKAIAWVELLTGHVGMFKIGFELQQCMLLSIINPDVPAGRTTEDVVRENAIEINKLFFLLNGNVFYDGKYHDIPNTVGGAAEATARMGVKMFNVHASGDLEAMQKAVANRGEAFVLGVTVLTTIDYSRCGHIYGMSNVHKVLDLVEIIHDSGAHGVICSPQEVAEIRRLICYDDLALITPGVRPEWASTDDQKRVMTPFEAMKAGSDALVIGRPIAKHTDPVKACRLIAEEIEAGLAAR